jgi:TfoX/Sxy family transcriptional regulator of competence genes
MAYNEKLAQRVRSLMPATPATKVVEKKMFGGLCFMVDDKMCVAITPDSILIRLSPEHYEAAITAKTLDPMLHIGRKMTGFGYISQDLLKTDKQLSHWMGLALEFNRHVPSPKRKTRVKTA